MTETERNAGPTTTAAIPIESERPTTRQNRTHKLQETKKISASAEQQKKADRTNAHKRRRKSSTPRGPSRAVGSTHERGIVGMYKPREGGAMLGRDKAGRATTRQQHPRPDPTRAEALMPYHVCVCGLAEGMATASGERPLLRRCRFQQA